MSPANEALCDEGFRSPNRRVGSRAAGRPDVARMAKGEVAALMDVAARNQPYVKRTEHLHKLGAYWLRYIANRGAGFLGIVRGHQK